MKNTDIDLRCQKGPTHYSRDVPLPPASDCGSPISILWQFMWDLWWEK